MATFTAAELHEKAAQYERQIADPRNADDPRWLRRWAAKIRRLAAQKEQALAHKQAARRDRGGARPAGTEDISRG